MPTSKVIFVLEDGTIIKTKKQLLTESIEYCFVTKFLSLLKDKWLEEGII